MADLIVILAHIAIDARKPLDTLTQNHNLNLEPYGEI